MNLCPICGEPDDGPTLWDTETDPGEWPPLIVAHLPFWLTNLRECWCGENMGIAHHYEKGKDTYTSALHVHMEEHGGVYAHFMDHLMGVKQCNLKP